MSLSFLFHLGVQDPGFLLGGPLRGDQRLEPQGVMGSNELAWPTQCRLVVRGLPPGVSVKEFHTRVDSSKFCSVLLENRRYTSKVDSDTDTWSCEFVFNPLLLRDMHPDLMALPELPLYNGYEFGSPPAYVMLLCWRHVPFLYRLHAPFHNSVVGPGPGDVTADLSLLGCVSHFCQRRLEMYRQRFHVLVEAQQRRVEEREERLRFYDEYITLWRRDPELTLEWWAFCSPLFSSSFLHFSFSAFLSFSRAFSLLHSSLCLVFI